MRRLLLAILCTMSFQPTEALAFVDDPYITPAHPSENSPISVHVTTGWCHAPTDGPDQADLVWVSPGHLQLIADGVVLPEAHPFCIHPPFTNRFDIGSLPAGSYSLQFFIRDDIGGSGLVGFGSVSFTVLPTATIPALSLWTAALMATLLCAWGVTRFREASSQH